MLLILVEILIALILALYTLASLPMLAAAISSSDFLRQISSPIFVFTLLNASIILLSLGRAPPPKSAAGVPSSDAESVRSPIGADLKDEFEIRAQRASASDEEATMVSASSDDVIQVTETIDGGGGSGRRRSESVKITRAAESDLEEEIVEELSNAEFNRIIEAFLEKQKRFHYQENLSILV